MRFWPWRAAAFVRFTRADLPAAVRPWPEGAPVPAPLAGNPRVQAPDGLYAAYHADGQLACLARVSGGAVGTWLSLDPGQARGTLDSSGVAVRFHPDGTLEGFNPWDDSDDRHPARQSFERWVRTAIAEVCRGRR